MNIFGKFTIEHPRADCLLIHRDPGLMFWSFILVYTGFTTVLNSVFGILLWEAFLPRTLTCYQQSQTISCNYIIPGWINKKTIEIKDVKKAILSQTPNGETIVLNSKNPWIALEPTTNATQNIQVINQGLVRLNQGADSWKLAMYPTAQVRYFLLFVCIPIGVLLLLTGCFIMYRQGTATLAIDAQMDTVSIVRLGRLRSQLSSFKQLEGVDCQIAGYLGALSDKFGIYGGDAHYRRQNHRIVRLLFTSRRPFVFHQQRFARGGGQTLIVAINKFIEDNK